MEVHLDATLKLDIPNMLGVRARNILNDVWLFDFADPAKPWVSSPLIEADLPALLAFSFDPTHERSVRDLLHPNALAVMTQIGFALEEHLDCLGAKVPDAKIRGYKRMPSAISLAQKREIAGRLWSHKDIAEMGALKSTAVTFLQSRSFTLGEITNPNRTDHKFHQETHRPTWCVNFLARYSLKNPFN